MSQGGTQGRSRQLAIPSARNTTSAAIIFTTMSEASTKTTLRQRVERERGLELMTARASSLAGYRLSGHALYARIPFPINPYPARWK